MTRPIFWLKPDVLTVSGVPVVDFDTAYTPMSYGEGDVCEKCWIDPEITSPYSGWIAFNATLVAVGRNGCPHGSER